MSVTGGARHELPIGRRLLFTALVTVAACAVAAVAAEVALRLAGWRAPGFYVGEHGPLPLRHVGRHGGSYPPGDGELIGFSSRVAWRVNGDGFRERERVPKGAGEVRVGLLGDSILAGWGVAEDARFASLWRARAAEAHADFTLWNLGAPGAGTAHLADVLDGVGRKYQLDAIVLAFFADNELEDNCDRYTASGAASPRPAPAGGGREEPWQGARNLLRNHSRLALYLWLHGGHGILYRLDRLPPLPERFSRCWAETARALEGFRAAVGDCPWRILYLPAREEWDDGFWAALAGGDPQLAGRRFVLRDAVLGWAQDHGVPFADATPCLGGLPAAEVKFPSDGHWTAAGHRAVADCAAILDAAGLPAIARPPAPPRDR